MTPRPPTGRRDGGGNAVAPAQRLKEELQPTWFAVWDHWGEMGELTQSKLQKEIKRLEQSGHAEQMQIAVALRGHASQIENVMFKCMDRLDSFFRLVEKSIEAKSVQPETSTRDSSEDVLDAYLGDTVVPRSTTTNRSTQTDEQVETTSPSKAPKRKSDAMADIEIFDAMAKKLPVEGTKAKREIKPEVEQFAPKMAKQSRSIAPAQPTHDSSQPKSDRNYYRVPLELIAGKKTLEVLGHRDRCSQREYEVRFHGLEKPVWVPMRHAPPDMKRVVLAYNKKRKQEKELDRQTRRDDQMDAGGVYIVDMIVGHRFENGKKEYLVKWDGYDTDENTWERASKLRNEVPGIVREYERKLAKKAQAKHVRQQQSAHTEEEEDDQEEGYYGHFTATSAGEASVDEDDDDDTLSKDDDLAWTGKGKAMFLRGLELSPQVE